MAKQYKLGIIGYGGMATWHHQNLDRVPEILPYGVYDIDPARQSVAEERGLKVYQEADALLSDPEIDIVLVACPNNFHAAYSIRAMRAGKNVVCEKPVTMNSDEFLSVMAAKEETGMHFSVHQNRRWDSDYLTVRKAIADDMIGRPYRIVSKVLGSRGIPEGWRAHEIAGGGMMLDWGVHLIDQIYQIVGQPVKTVTAHMYNTNYDEVDDGFTADFTFADGLVATVEVDTNAFINEPRWIVRGKTGTLVIENWDLKGCIVEAENSKTVWEDEILYTSAGPTKTMAPRTSFTEVRHELPAVKDDWINFYRNFIAVLEGRETARVLPAENLYVMRLMEACFLSSAENRSVELDVDGTAL